jgi:signal transduction histidine kinase/HAMP domain-containing protein
LSENYHPAASGAERRGRRARAGSTDGNGGTRTAQRQLHALLHALEAAQSGDFAVRLPSGSSGVMAQIARAFNAVVSRNEALVGELVRLECVVGREGRMTERASLGDVEGQWRTAVASMNSLVADLVQPTAEVARVLSAVAEGDLTQKIALQLENQPVKGEFLRIGKTVNSMVDQLSSFAAETTRVAKEVGTDGKLGGQAEVPQAAGLWRDLTDNVNRMASNLTAQVRNIAEVSTAVARGDLSKKITVDAKGEILELKNTINTMVDQLNSFAGEVTRVAREVGTEGRLGGQADVRGVSGVWKDLTDNVNFMASNLTGQVRNIALVTTAVAKGDLSKKITVDVKGEILELKNTINTMVDRLSVFAAQVTDVARTVGVEGRLGAQAEVPGVAGTWKDLTDNVNLLANNLTEQVRNIANVTTAVANGDLSQKITVDVKGEVLALKDTINTMVDQLRSFASEVTRVAKQVGTEGKLGAQAEVPGVAGVWKDLTDNVNVLAGNLTDQVRNIAKVTTAVANGDLSQKISVEARGEILALKDTINAMVDQLRSFAGEVTRVAREVGTEGRLGGQATVPSATGTWRQLTDNVNQLAASLTTQIRAISEVATAVTKGDLTRSITVGAEGEVARLKDNINQMIVNLRETTQKNQEQDWLKTNLARFSSMMQGQKDLDTVSRLIMSELTPLVSAHHGAFFLLDQEEKTPVLKLRSTYAYRQRKTVANRFYLGEGIVGQCALERKTILLTRVPPDYIQISSGLGEGPPLNILVLPVLFEGQVKAVIELASFNQFSAIHQIFLDQLTESIGVVLNMIAANMRTGELLQQSQGLTQELQNQSRELTQQQEELKRSNTALEKQGRYKSDFLANMSHELRTPLNSLLILAKLLADNKDGHLSDKETEYAKTIHASGGDLLALINEILDLSKVESGKIQIDARDLTLEEVRRFVERTFAPLAEQKGLDFAVRIERAPASIVTDAQRLQQVLKNLLANAFKFTDRGSVELRISPAPDSIRFEALELASAEQVIAFSVVDTGIGIPKHQQQIVFEAFQQADGTTSRKYGGTGLGLSISREIARLLGGEIRVESEPAAGSTFTLYLPDRLRQAADPGPSWPTAEAHAPVFLRADDEPPDEGEERKNGDEGLSGKKVLVVDDDMRNVFALTSVLETYGMEVVFAENGSDGIAALEGHPDVSVVLMDVMMPGMDGYETMRQIRRDPQFESLPIIAVTAKALHEDRERCLTAGASDYLPKPVENDRLVEMIRRWTA